MKRPAPVTVAAILTCLAALVLPCQRLEAKEAPEGKYVPGEVVFRVHDRPSARSVSQVADLVEQATFGRAVTVETILPADARDNLAARRLGLDRLYVAKYGEGAPVEELVEQIENIPDVQYAEPNYLYHYGAWYPNDPRFDPDQWNLDNYGQAVGSYGPGTPDADVDAPEAWDLELGDPGVVIAILDSGVDWDHPDLASNIWMNPGETENGLDDDGNTYVDDIRGWDFAQSDNDPTDDGGPHGTLCAGAAAAETNNGVGIAGMCPNCRLMALKCSHLGGCPTSYATPAIYYAIEKGAQIINMSFQGLCSQALHDLLSYAHGEGVILVTVAGNDNEQVGVNDCPCYDDHTLCVGGTNPDDGRFLVHGRQGSNYGPSVDLAAPARDITSTAYDDTYTTLTGTSFSAPQVSGLAGLILSRYPGFTKAQVESILVHLGVDVFGVDIPTPDQLIGTGRMNAHRALTSFCTDGTFGGECAESGGPWRCVDGELVYDASCDATAVAGSSGDAIPLQLSENMPNPFSSATQIRFDVGRTQRVTLNVYDVSGRIVRSLVDRIVGPGSHVAAWDGRDDSGHSVPSGVYFYRVDSGGRSTTRKMTLAR